MLALLGLAGAAGAGAGLLGNLDASSFTQFEAARDHCYAQQGIDLRTTADVSPAAVDRCSQTMRDFENGQTGRYLVAAIFGLFCGAVVLGGILLGLRMRRRRQGVAPSDALGPPAS